MTAVSAAISRQRGHDREMPVERGDLELGDLAVQAQRDRPASSGRTDVPLRQ